MFKRILVYSDSNEAESRLINLSHIEHVKPHANVLVDPGAVDTSCCEIGFFSGASAIALIDIDSLAIQLQALTGTIDELGSLA